MIHCEAKYFQLSKTMDNCGTDFEYKVEKIHLPKPNSKIIHHILIITYCSVQCTYYMNRETSALLSHLFI